MVSAHTGHAHGEPSNVAVRVAETSDDRRHVLCQLRRQELNHRAQSAATQQLCIVACLARRVKLQPVVERAVCGCIGIARGAGGGGGVQQQQRQRGQRRQDKQ